MIFQNELHNRIENSFDKLQKYVKYLDKLKYKNEITIQASADLRELCGILNDILVFDTYGNSTGPIA